MRHLKATYQRNGISYSPKSFVYISIQFHYSFNKLIHVINIIGYMFW
ncbi:hypothetical protein BN126_3580 [Cronobacter sakazakii 680]|nr:hypothetical protein BN126_3580 [Cronobacter sakazakii 680]